MIPLAKQPKGTCESISLRNRSNRFAQNGPQSMEIKGIASAEHHPAATPGVD